MMNRRNFLKAIGAVALFGAIPGSVKLWFTRGNALEPTDEFEGLDWVEIGPITNVGQMGEVSNVVNFSPRSNNAT